MPENLSAQTQDDLEVTIGNPVLSARLHSKPVSVVLDDVGIEARSIPDQPLKAVIFASPPQAAHGLNDHTDTDLGEAEDRTDGYVITWDGDEGMFVLSPPSGGGASSFLDLTDTPNSYTGADGLFVAVDGNQLIFTAGIPGPQGDPGADGADGEDGESAYEIAVAEGFIGTIEEWLESLVGPQGEQGEQGIQGVQGLPGEDGDSAYEVAVANGFIGTEAEWLESLVGPQGEQGIQGIQGDPGPTGDTGATGERGPAGGNTLSYKFDSGTSGDPGAGHIRLGNADPSLAFSITISETDDNGVDVTTWLSLIGSTSHLASGYLSIWKKSDPTTFYVYAVLTGNIDASGYWQYIITNTAGQGTFADEDEIYISHTLNGDDGVHGGSSFRYAFSTTITDSDPGSGELRFNHGTFASITRLFIDDSAYPNISGAEAWIQTFDDSDSAVRGYIKVTKITDQTVTRLFEVTGASVDGTGYWKIVVNPVATQGTLNNGDGVIVSFTRTGDKGDTGATGETGATGPQGDPGDAADIAAEIAGAATDDTIDDPSLWGYVTGGVFVKTTWSNIKAVMTAALEAATHTWAAVQTFTANPLIQLASARLTIDATTGAPAILFKRAGADTWRIIHDASSGYFTLSQTGVGDWFRLLDASGNAVFVGSVKVGDDAQATQKLNVSGDATTANASINRYANSTAGPILVLRKSRNGTIGNHTIVQNNDEIGHLDFRGSDGSAFRDGAMIAAFVDGTPGASDMPGRLEFRTTPDGSATPAIALTIKQDKEVEFEGLVEIKNGNPLYLSDPDVAHGMTTLLPTNVWGGYTIADPVAGGVSFFGVSDDSVGGLFLTGIIGSTTPSSTTSAMTLTGAKKSGTFIQALASTEVLITLINSATTLLKIMGDGKTKLGGGASPDVLLHLQNQAARTEIKAQQFDATNDLARLIFSDDTNTMIFSFETGKGAFRHTFSDGFVPADNYAALYNAISAALHLGTNDIVRVTVTGAGDVGFGITSPSAKTHTFQSSLGSAVQRWTSQAVTGTNVVTTLYQNKVLTTNATVTTLHTIATSSNSRYMVEAKVLATRTAGAAGANGDMASYHIEAAYKNVAGTVSIASGSVAVLSSFESQAAWDCTFTISGTNILLRVTGAASNDISWTCDVWVKEMAS